MSSLTCFCLLIVSVWQTDGGVVNVSEGYVQAARQDLSGLAITVWQLPENPVVGQVQFGVEVREVGTQVAFGDARVRIYATPPNGGERLVSPAINTPVSPQFYEALLNVNSTGFWQFEVTIDNYGSLDFGTDVTSRLRSGANTVRARVLFFAIQGLFGLALILLIIRSRRRRVRQSE